MASTSLASSSMGALCSGNHISLSLSVVNSEVEEDQEDPNMPSKYNMFLEDVGGLLKAIHVTLGIEEEKKKLSLHDRMYSGLNDPKGHTFPVHSLISDMIKNEWQEPEKKPFFSRYLKRRFPFREDTEVPKFDAAFSQISKSADLAFEDMGYFEGFHG